MQQNRQHTTEWRAPNLCPQIALPILSLRLGQWRKVKHIKALWGFEGASVKANRSFLNRNVHFRPWTKAHS